MKKVLFVIICLLTLNILFFNVNTISAADSFQQGLNKSAGNTGMGYIISEKPESVIYAKIGQVLNISTIFLGVVFLGLIIYGGIIWMLARGNQQEVEKAKNIIIYAVVGLAVVLGAYAITTLFNILWSEIKAS